MQPTFTKPVVKSRYSQALLLAFFVLMMFSVNAQRNKPQTQPQTQQDSIAAPATKDTAAQKTSIRPKEIVKLEDVNIPEEMYAKIKAMGPNQLVDFRESYTYNIKAEDQIEYSITIKLGFSQDMITGIVRWVPLYASSSAPPEITQIKIPVKFCCTTKIDTTHKKQHCGKMSELNDFEDYEHCKDWIQVEAGKNMKDAVINKKGKGVNATDSTESFGKGGKLSKKDLKKKKGKTAFDEDEATDSTSAAKDSTANYGKPEKPSKKDLKKKKGKEEVREESNSTDSTSAKKEDAPDYGKPEKPSKKDAKKKKGKDEEVSEPAIDSSAAVPEPPKKPNKKEEKKPKKEEVKKDSADEGSYGKPQALPKESKKKKGKEKENAPPTDSLNYRPEPVIKDEEVPSNSSDSASTSKPDGKKEKKKKKG